MEAKSFIVCVAYTSAAAALGGCGAIPPRVTYAPYVDQAAGGAAAERKGFVFRPRRSVLLLNRDREARYQAQPAPFELAPDQRYMPLYEIAGADDVVATTQLKVTYADNTKFVDQLEVSTKDYVVETIGKIAEIAKAAVPTLAGVNVTPDFRPTKIDPMDAGASEWHRDTLNEGLCLRLRDVAVESQVTMDDFVAAAQGRWVRTFPVPACATGIVDLAAKCADDPRQTVAEESIRVVYAHHRNIVAVPLPSSGTVKMHTVCGASVTVSDKQDRTDVLDYIRNALKAANDVQSAIDNKRSQKPAAGAGAKK